MRPLHPAVVPLVALGAGWPVLLWYARGSIDASNGPWGLLALATAAWLLGCAPPARRPAPVPHRFLVPGLGLLAYTLCTLAGLPMALRALGMSLAWVGLASAWRLGRRLDPALLGLALLALPLGATLQFFAGYPLRVVAGTLAVALLRSNGLAVSLDGVLLAWDGRQIAIDAPCAGLHMLWAAAYLVCTACALWRFTAAQTLRGAVLALAAVVAANGVRAAALFYLETGLLPLPGWAHEAAGLAVFAAAGLGIVAGLHRIGHPHRSSPP